MIIDQKLSKNAVNGKVARERERERERESK